MAKDRKEKELPKGKPTRRVKRSSSTRSQRHIAHGPGLQPKDVNLTKILQTLKPHDHLCLIYESPEEWRAAAVPFIAVGLKRGEKCLYIADTSTADEIRKYLAEEGIDVASAEKSGQLSILHQSEAYTREGSFDPASMIALLVEETEKAVAEGYPALRVTGEMTWVLRDYPGSEKLLEYEAKLNRDFFPYHPCLAICQYDRWKFDSEVIKGVIMTHPLLVRGNHIYHNFYYIPPEEFLNRKRAELEVQHWLNNLEREQQIQETLRQSEERYRTLAEQSLMGLVVIQDFHITFANTAFAEIYGYTIDELLSFTPEKVGALTHPEDQALVWGRFRDRLAGKAVPSHYEYRGIRKDGTVCWLEIHATRIEYGGKPSIQGAIIDITERKRAEEALRLSEQNFRDSIEKSPLGIRIVTADGNTLYVNKTLLDMCGYDSLEELKAVPRNQLYTPESYAEHRERVNKRKRGEYTPSHYEISIVRKDGQVRRLSVSRGEVLWDGEKQSQVVYQDITERKRVEKALRQSEERYRTMLDEMKEGYYETDIRGTFTFVNDAMSHILGYSRDELIGLNYKVYTSKELVKPTFEAYNRVYRTGEPLRWFPSVEIRKDGRQIFVEDSVFPIRNEKGEVIGFRGISRDITEHRKATEALQKSEERYRQLAENAGEAIFVVQDGMIKFMNPKGAELSGYSIEELVSKPFAKFIHPDDSDIVVDRYARRLKGEAVPEVYDFRIVRKDGDIIWGELNAVQISWEDRPAVLCFMSDITERKQAEEALRQSEERYRAILEKMEDSYFEVDLAGNLTFVNSSACRHLGYSREELIRMNYKEFTAEDYIEFVFRVFNGVYRTGTPNKGFPWKIIRKDGSPGFIDVSVTPLRNDKGKIIGFSGVGRDITERRKIEEQLILTDRLASIGQLAAGIAHELNNPLTGVIGFSDLLLERDLPADVKADLETVNQEAMRAVNIVKGLLAFAREQRIEKAQIDINSIIEGVLQLRSYEQRVSNIEVDARFASALPPVMGNGAQLQQVFINIILNAEQAMLEAHGRGKLTIATERVGDMVRASFTDDGPGISPANMKQLFTPFFTTREVGKGTGLGLSICHGIVTEHGGKVYAESELGKGATFVVELPISK
jgi:two-component system NtrC family sensor kinase